MWTRVKEVTTGFRTRAPQGRPVGPTPPGGSLSVLVRVGTGTHWQSFSLWERPRGRNEDIASLRRDRSPE